MTAEDQGTALAAARDAFVRYVLEHHGIDPAKARIVDRTELHTPPFYVFVAVQGGGPGGIYVRGASDGTRVITYASPTAFGDYLKAVDFHGTERVSAAQFVELYRSLQHVEINRYMESAFPLLSREQVATAARHGVDEALDVPEAVREGSEKLVRVWWQYDPGPHFELWTFRVTPENAFTVEKRFARRRAI